jgi:16S rRNA (uracil1498-N3)-methyltransferase
MSLRLYVDAELRHGDEIDLPAAAARHVQVRRLQPGDGVLLFNGRGGQWRAGITRIGRSAVRVQLQTFEAVERELPVRVTLAMGMPANERMDWLVEKASELGVAAIVPLHCERSVLRLSGERAARKREHWQAVAVAACEQCGRNRVPQVAPVQPLAAWLDALEAPPGEARRLLLSLREDAALPTRGVHGAAGWVVLSGPEGGLSAAEEDAARARGFAPTRLGARILRAETAPLALLSWIGLDQ